MMKKFDSSLIKQSFIAYKESKTEATLNDLYEAIDFIVTQVTKNIAKTFRKKHPETFEDLQQSVRLEIFRYLGKLADISIDEEQFVRLLVSATVYKFRLVYYQDKKKMPVVFDYYDGAHYNRSDWKPENDVPIFMSFGNDSKEESDMNIYSGLDEILSIKPNQNHYVYLNALPKRITDQIKKFNKYKDKEELILYCVENLIDNKIISKKVLEKLFGISNVSFWIKYSDSLYHLALIKIYKEDKVNIFHE